MRYLLSYREADRYAERPLPQPVRRDRPRQQRFFSAFDRGFNRLRTFYGSLLGLVLQHRGLFVAGFLGFVAMSLSLFPLVGRDFFPSVDAGTLKLHVRGPPGTRIEETERRRVAGIEETHPRRHPRPSETETMLDNSWGRRTAA